MSLPAEFDHHAELDDFEKRLSQVDFHLERGIRTLIAITEIARDDNVKIPSSISEPDRMEGEYYPLCHALVCATMHKIWRHRRRHKYLTADLKEEDLKKLIDWLPHPFSAVGRDSSKKLGFVKSLDSRAFGALNPLTASQVLRVVLHKGEKETLSPIGILALFSVVWALSRRHGETAIAGAALVSPPPTKAACSGRRSEAIILMVSMKCLLCRGGRPPSSPRCVCRSGSASRELSAAGDPSQGDQDNL